jgi:hypothetical protein
MDGEHFPTGFDFASQNRVANSVRCAINEMRLVGQQHTIRRTG